MITLNSIAEIKAFQRKVGLVVDGIAGPQTRRVLAEYNRPISKSARVEPDKSAIKKQIGEISPSSTKSLAALEKLVGATASKTLRDMVWALPLTTKRRITELIFHCAATPEGRQYTVRDVAAWHKARGWDRVGYHFIVLLDGTVQIGCPIGQQGIHTKGRNKSTVGASYIGGLSKDMRRAKDTRTPRQTLAMAYLAQRLKAVHPITRVSGHNDYAQKACPSFKVSTDILGSI